MGARRIHSDTVREIRRRYEQGYTVSEMVDSFGLSRTAVSGIVNGKTHRDVVETDMEPLARVMPRKSMEHPPDTPPGEPTKFSRAAAALAARRR